ncbi:MAG TPA: glycosyltransferase family 39 protein, partial [Thermoanaerobaculia bacterium]|nr:glycosyltransferase family 39 protein [Thermoanaerobaculia bacterium]
MRSHVRVLIVFAAALFLKGAVLAALHDHPLLQPRGDLDPVWYAQLAKRVAAGDLLLAPEPFFISPLYIYFLGAVFACGGGLLAARIVQIVLGAIAVVLAGETARALFGPRAGWIASALLALTGVVTFYEVTLLQSSLDPILVAATLFFTSKWSGGLSARRTGVTEGRRTGVIDGRRAGVIEGRRAESPPL